MSEDCRDGVYTSPNGLEFEVLCGINTFGAEFKVQRADNFTICLDRCSTYTSEACFGVTFNADNELCFLKNATIFTVDREERSSVSLGLVNRDQFEPLPKECPFPHQSRQRTRNGMEFTIHCDLDFAGQDYNLANKAAARIHTDTMQDCLEACSTARPGCFGVAWNPDNSEGYANCYAKASNEEVNLVDVPWPIHAAVAEVRPQDPQPGDCDDGSEFEMGTKRFEVYCVRNSTFDDIASFHEDTLQSCADRCAGYSEEGGETCGAVVFGASGRQGYENCRLKITGGTLDRVEGLTVLVVTGDAADGGGGGGGVNQTSSMVQEDGDDSSRTSAIVGGVVGAVAALALLLFLGWWFRRRQLERQRRAEKSPSASVLAAAAAPAPPMYEKYGGQTEVEMASQREGVEMEHRREHPGELTQLPPELEAIERPRELESSRGAVSSGNDGLERGGNAAEENVSAGK